MVLVKGFSQRAADTTAVSWNTRDVFRHNKLVCCLKDLSEFFSPTVAKLWVTNAQGGFPVHTNA